MIKLNFDETLDRINDGLYISEKNVLTSALNRVVWVAEWHLPGCLSDSRDVCLTKSEAILSSCAMAESENGIPRGMKSALIKYGRFDSNSDMFGRCINTVSRMLLRDLF